MKFWSPVQIFSRIGDQESAISDPVYSGFLQAVSQHFRRFQLRYFIKATKMLVTSRVIAWQRKRGVTQAMFDLLRLITLLKVF